MPVVSLPSSGSGENVSLQQIGAALAAFGEHLVILDAASEEMIWCSQGFVESFPALGGQSTLADFIAVFDGLQQCLVCIETGQKQMHTVSVRQQQGGEGRFEATMVSLEKKFLALKLEDISRRTSAIQRYLEDREQLFSTSRTISVSEMATTLAHEINQPIGTVTSLLCGIRLRLENGENAQSEIVAAIDQAVDQTRFAANIIARIRDYTHSRKPVNQTLELVELVCSCASLLDWELVRENIDLQLDLGNDLLMVSADETMLQQVFVNLLRNAIEAMRGTDPASRQLRIVLRKNDAEEEVEIAIADNGVGLTADAKNQLFVPFVSTKPTGMGVGLNICRSFVELHQGRLWLSSNEAGGCTSHVLLPLLGK
ncbi:sensor histidine kinase [Thiolapillus sp.]